jgi:protein transport protein SEC23
MSYQELIAKGEQQDGVRFAWNALPDNAADAARVAVPLSMLYNPLAPIDGRVVQYQPVRCHNQSCGAILNPYCQVDFHAKFWVCPFCFTRTNFPSNYGMCLYLLMA